MQYSSVTFYEITARHWIHWSRNKMKAILLTEFWNDFIEQQLSNLNLFEMRSRQWPNWVSTAEDNGLVPSGNNPLHETTLIKIGTPYGVMMPHWFWIKTKPIKSRNQELWGQNHWLLLLAWRRVRNKQTPQIAKFMEPTWGPPGSCRPQMSPMLGPWTLLSGAGK